MASTKLNFVLLDVVVENRLVQKATSVSDFHHFRSEEFVSLKKYHAACILYNFYYILVWKNENFSSVSFHISSFLKEKKNLFFWYIIPINFYIKKHKSIFSMHYVEFAIIFFLLLLCFFLLLFYQNLFDIKTYWRNQITIDGIFVLKYMIGLKFMCMAWKREHIRHVLNICFKTEDGEKMPFLI